MPEILGDVQALAYLKRWAKKEGVWAKSAFCGQNAKFAGKNKFIHLAGEAQDYGESWLSKSSKTYYNLFFC